MEEKKTPPHRKDLFLLLGEGEKSDLQNLDKTCKRQNLKTRKQEAGEAGCRRLRRRPQELRIRAAWTEARPPGATSSPSLGAQLGSIPRPPPRLTRCFHKAGIRLIAPTPATQIHHLRLPPAYQRWVSAAASSVPQSETQMWQAGQREAGDAESLCDVNYKLAFSIGTCHLPLRGLNHAPLQLLNFNTPERSSGGEQKWGTGCSGKNWQNRPSDS